MELAGNPEDPCAGYMVEDSDLEYSDCSDGESSDNEDCSLEHHSNKSSSQHDLSSEDEFEKDMAGEVLLAMKLMVSQAAAKKDAKKPRVANVGPSVAESVAEGNSAPGHSQFYDEVYFDSSESSDEGDIDRSSVSAGNSEKVPTQKRRRDSAARKVKKLTNDELFYDPNMDEEDEKWMNRRRMAYHNVKVSQQLERKKKARLSSNGQTAPPPKERDTGRVPSGSSAQVLPKSDAVLNCPACMATVCIDCQRHDVYPNQYRAMFVLNCRVMKDEVLKYVPKPSKKSRKRSKGANRVELSSEAGQLESDSQEGDGYHPVRCAECNTEVAVVDTDEVFHFFNVLPSAPS